MDVNSVKLREDHEELFNGYLLDESVNSLLYTLWFNRKILRRNDIDEYEREVIRGTVSFTMNQLDGKKVPFWVQNNILHIAELGLGYGDFTDRILNKFKKKGAFTNESSFRN